MKNVKLTETSSLEQMFGGFCGMLYYRKNMKGSEERGGRQTDQKPVLKTS